MEVDNEQSQQEANTTEPGATMIDTAVNIDRSVVGNFNINADVRNTSDASNTTGVNVRMDSGGLIQNLTATTIIHQGTSKTYIPTLTEQELIRCRNDLKTYYKANCKIRLLPWLKRDPRNRLEMKHLFTNLYLIYGVPNAIEIPIHVRNYLELLPPLPGSLRALIRGKAGAGKTTLLEKLALDWAEGKLPPSYNDISLFFLLKMKSIKHDDTLIDAVFRQRLFGRDVERLRPKLSKFIDDYSEKVIVLIDAVDEYTSYGSDGFIESIIHNDSLRSASVIVTSRPWRAFEILDKSPNTYVGRNYEVKGYTQVQVSTYLKQFFERKPKMADNLLKQMNETGICTGIATIPIMCMLICVLFRDLKEVLPDTMSGLYNVLHSHLLKHYDKEKDNLEAKVTEEDKLSAIGKLGELAFNGLLNNQLSFEEGEFIDADIFQVARKIGLIVQTNSNTMKNCYEFFHKTFQEWFGASYMANRDAVSFQELCKSMFTNVPSCLDKELLLRFVSGISLPVANMVIKQLVGVVQGRKDLSDYNENKLNLPKTKKIQEFIELIIKCNRETKSGGRFNELLNTVFEKCYARFMNVNSMTLQAVAYMLKFGGAGKSCPHCGGTSADYCSHKLHIADFKIGCHTVEMNDDIDKLWGEFEAVGDEYYAKCKVLSKLPETELQIIFEKVKDILPKGIQHLSLARKLAFADLCEFMETWKGDYSLMGSVVENICFTEITNLTFNGVNLSEHCKLLCRNLQLVKSLKKLDLGSTSLESVHCSFIGEMLESVRGLQVLNLYKNKLEDITKIVQRLQYLPELTRLDFETTYLTSESMSHFGKNLKWVPKLERFYIRSSPLLSEVFDDFVDGMQGISDLRRLNITLGELSCGKISNFINCLNRFQNLQLLYIDGLFSAIIDTVFRLLATDLLPNLGNLKSLRLQGKLGLLAQDAKLHGIQNETAKIFASNLKYLPNLLVLRLTYLWIQNEGLETIRHEVHLRQQKNTNFRFELYPDYDNEDSPYVPQDALMNLNTT